MEAWVKVSIMGSAAALLLVGSASAADFTPELHFELSDTKTGANPEMNIHVAQDVDEDELTHVTLRVPKGFKLPADSKVADGDRLGTATITIDAGPRCAEAGPVSAPATLPDRSIVERDRTDEQADRGVKAVWVVDLQPVTSIPLEVTGSKKKGWKLDGDIPANALTCPPFTFDATVFSVTETGGVPILKNPKSPGDKVFKAVFRTQESDSVVTIKQVISITE